MRLRTVDVAAYLGFSRQRVTQIVAEGKLPASRRDHPDLYWTPERDRGLGRVEVVANEAVADSAE